MKRISCLILSLLAAAAAVSCADSTVDSTAQTTASSDKSKTPTSETTAAEPSLLDSLGEKDLGGMVYTIFDCNAHPDFQSNIPEDKANGELVNDALYTRDVTLEERYNCEIQYIQEDNISMLKTMVAAGDNDFQLLIHPMTYMSSECGGYLANLCEVPYLEPDQKWWNPLLYENLRLYDAMYFTSSDIAPSIYQMPTCLFLNLKLYADYDFDQDIFQMVIDGKWTIDQLRSMTKDMNVDMNNDNMWSIYDDFFGLAVHTDSTEAILTMLIGAGVQMSHIDDSGENITCNLLDDAHAVEVIEGVSDLFLTIDHGSGDINDFSNIMFKENRALFFMHKLESAATHLRDMEADYLILPSPKWDENQDSYYSFLSPHGQSFIGMPITVQEDENVGFLTEALARYSHQYVRPIAYDIVYKEKDSRDERTAEVLDILLDSLYIDFASLYDFGTVNTQLIQVLYKDKPLVSSIEKRQKAAAVEIKKLIESWIPVD